MLFEKASRIKARFETVRGNVNVEDLWDLPLTSKDGMSLDDIAKKLSKNVKETAEESFVVKTNSTNETLNLKFDIVKHIIAIRLEEVEVKQNKKASELKKSRLLSIIEKKESENLENLSVDELKEMADKL